MRKKSEPESSLFRCRRVHTTGCNSISSGWFGYACIPQLERWRDGVTPLSQRDGETERQSSGRLLSSSSSAKASPRCSCVLDKESRSCEVRARASQCNSLRVKSSSAISLVFWLRHHRRDLAVLDLLFRFGILLQKRCFSFEKRLRTGRSFRFQALAASG